MSAVLVVLLGIVFPLLILFVGFFIIIKSKNNETIKSMILGILLSILGGLILLFVSIFIVHELTIYAPYFKLK